MTVHVAILAPYGVQLLDIVGPSDVFTEANEQLDEPFYRIEMVSYARGPLTGSSGLMLVAGRSIYDPFKRVDTLLIAGSPRIQEEPVSEEFLAWIRHTAAGAQRYGSVCSGAFILAQTGLLNGRRATTHWSQAAAFAQRFPEVRLQPDRIFTTDGPVWTSAGVTAGIDLALAMVEEDLGLDLALKVARKLVVFLKRQGGQSQFSSHLVAQTAEKAPIKAIQDYVLANLAEDLSIAALAAKAGMSERNFARTFRQDAGMTPADFVERARLEEAKRLLEDADMPMQRVAQRAGFHNMIRMRRAFLRTIGVTPGAYRQSFAEI